jgi:hypothetical protein
MAKGDKVLAVTEKFVAIEHQSGEVDIIPIEFGEGPPRVENGDIITISFGDNAVETVLNGEHGDVRVITW